jgi:hypothetical protein
MMVFSAKRAAGIVVASLGLISRPVHADGRAEFVTCQAMVDRAAQSVRPGAADAPQDDAALARCRQIIRDWTLRESRMSVDEHGRPLR